MVSFSRTFERDAMGPPPRLPPAAEQEKPSYIAGLDLGQISDPTALCVLEVTTSIQGNRTVRHYACRHLQRWLGVSYLNITEALRPMMAQLDRPRLVVDGTGVGTGVVDILRKAKLPIRQLFPIVITAGHTVTPGSKGGANVPKRELISVAQSALQGDRLAFSPKLKEAAELRKELATFKVKINLNATESFEAWRDSDKDDLVLACCMAVWVGERASWRLTADKFFVG